MDPTTTLLMDAGKAVGLSPIAMALWIPLIIILANRIAKIIPDNAVGPLNWLRIFFVILGLKVNNNTGVAPVQDSTGKIIERSDPSPDTAVAEEVLELAGAERAVRAESPIQQVFQLGAAAIQAKDQAHEG